MLKKLLSIQVILGVLLFFTPIYHVNAAGIAYDNSGTAQGSATTITLASFAVAATNPIIVCGIWANVGSGGDPSTGMTYNGSAMTKINAVDPGDGSSATGLWYIVGQSGTHDVVWSKSGTDLGYLVCASYTGASQTGQPDSQTTNTNAGGNLSTSVTVNTASSWIVAYSKSGGGTIAGTGTILTGRLQGPNNAQTYFYDTNGTASTGSNSTVINITGGAFNLGAYAVIKPAASTATCLYCFWDF